MRRNDELRALICEPQQQSIARIARRDRVAEVQLVDFRQADVLPHFRDAALRLARVGTPVFLLRLRHFPPRAGFQ